MQNQMIFVRLTTLILRVMRDSMILDKSEWKILTSKLFLIYYVIFLDKGSSY